MSVEKMSMGYEKDGFAFLIDGFELSKSFSPRKVISAPPYDSSHKAERYVCERDSLNSHMF